MFCVHTISSPNCSSIFWLLHFLYACPFYPVIPKNAKYSQIHATFVSGIMHWVCTIYTLHNAPFAVWKPSIMQHGNSGFQLELTINTLNCCHIFQTAIHQSIFLLLISIVLPSNLEHLPLQACSTLIWCLISAWSAKSHPFPLVSFWRASVTSFNQVKNSFACLIDLVFPLFFLFGASFPSATASASAFISSFQSAM